MKKLLVLSAALLGIFFTSCSSDDDDSGNPLIGSWGFFQEEYDGELEEGDDCSKKKTLIFREDMSFELEAYGSITGDPDECEKDSDSDTGTWAILSEGVLAVTYSEGDVEQGMYSIDGNTLTLTSTYEANGETETERSIYIRK
ncbi:lipocalin family protein [Cellulophaga sp. E16_2]|uniref:lipocalin family protein n=1 Tax=unclassified Cellulophaga TaxID=2634405 RepID=UPI0013FDFF13|nr:MULTISPECIES: lipocalin family protein [unclassified Cellulophaga]MBO0591467.1 lipocalin family protein [Cellulophaga sp. E16_2]